MGFPAYKSTFVAAFLALASCSYRIDNNQPEVRQDVIEGVGFQTVFKAVLQPRCVSCHGISGEVNLETYESVKANLALIEEVLAARAMPPSGPLPEDSTDLVLGWIRDGAPEHPLPQASPTPAPSPTPTPSPSPSPAAPVVEATYRYFSVNVFQPKCVGCHSATGRVSHIPLTSLAEIRALDPDLINRAVPEDSAIVRATKPRPAGADMRGFMPPVRTGIPGLTQEEADALQKWIELGLPE